MSMKAKKESHNIGWCANCGWVHTRVEATKVVDNGNLVIKPLCAECRKSSTVMCALCGPVVGNALFPITLTKRLFDVTEQEIYGKKYDAQASMCNVIIYVCAECRVKYTHAEMLDKLDEASLVVMCEHCEHRFVCFTSKSKDIKPLSQKDSKGFSKTSKEYNGLPSYSK